MTGKLHDKTGNRELCALYGKPNIRRRPRLHELQTDMGKSSDGSMSNEK